MQNYTNLLIYNLNNMRTFDAKKRVFKDSDKKYTNHIKKRLKQAYYQGVSAGEFIASKKRYPALLEVAWTIAIMVATAFITILYTK